MIFIKNMFVTLTILVIAIWVMPATADPNNFTEKHCYGLISECTVLKDDASESNNSNFDQDEWDLKYINSTLNDIKDELKIDCRGNNCRSDTEVVLEMIKYYSKYLETYRQESGKNEKPLTYFCQLAMNNQLFQKCIIKNYP